MRIIDAFVHLADTLVDDYDIIDFLQFLTERCVELVEIDEAAVMLTTPTGHLQAVASSSERTRLLELFELQNSDGPCLDAFRTGSVISASDLTGETSRWPIFAPEAVAVGFRAVHSVPLRLRQQVIGALNLMRVESGLLSAVDARLVHALSDIATVGVLQERALNEERANSAALQNALTSRVRIEQAKGILAERSGLSIDAAFQLLRAHARNNSLGLTNVAIGVVNNTILIEDRPHGSS
jgi:GAF domain-containing protein